MTATLNVQGSSMFVLYGTQGSGAASVEAALEIAGAPFRSVDAASWKAGPGRDELQRVNPLAQIPTLVLPEGGVLTESAAILIHLGDRFPESGLLPQSQARRAQAIRGLVYIAANCYAAIGVIDFPERWCADTDEPLRERIRTGTRIRLHTLWDVFADTFPATPFLSGAQVGALDLFACVVSKWSGARKHLAVSRPAFHDLLARTEAHPVVAGVFARHWPAT
jgi:GST-like protein